MEKLIGLAHSGGNSGAAQDRIICAETLSGSRVKNRDCSENFQQAYHCKYLSIQEKGQRGGIDLGVGTPLAFRDFSES